jgi:hypothetical protein
MKIIVFPVVNDELHAVLVDGTLNLTLAAIGNLLRDHGVYGPLSRVSRDQAIQLAETAMQIIATAGTATDTVEGAVLHFTSLGNTPEQDVYNTVTVNSGFRTLLGTIASLVTTREHEGTESEAFAMAAITVVAAAEQVFMPDTKITPDQGDNVLTAGQYVIIRDGKDDVSDGQLCKVLRRDEEPNYRPGDYAEGKDLAVYTPEDAPESVLVRCWTGYTCWIGFENRIPINPASDQDREALEQLFAAGNARSGEMIVEF